MTSVDWATVRDALRALTEVCEAEQRAVVTMDADQVSALTPRKRQIVAELGERFSFTLNASSAWPADIRALARQCRAVNRLTQRLLAITLRRMDALLHELGVQPDVGYGTAYVTPRRGRLDSRV